MAPVLSVVPTQEAVLLIIIIIFQAPSIGPAPATVCTALIPARKA